MPHIILETSTELNVQADDLLLHVNQAMLATGHFQAVDIKSRIIKTDASLVGIGEDNPHFVSARLLIMSGRSDAVKQQFATILLNVLTNYFTQQAQCVQCTVEVLELSAIYQKAMT